MEPKSADPHPEGVDPSAARVALHWVSSLRRGDVDALWPFTTRDYRLALTQWWMLANPNVLEDPAVAGKTRDAAAEEISTGDHDLFSHLRRVLARDLRASLAELGDLELVAGTAARVVSPGVELVALFVEEDVPSSSFAPGASARVVTVAVEVDGDGKWKVAGLNCLAVPGWPPSWTTVDASLRED